MAMQKDMMGRAVRDSFAKLDPRVQIQNPVMFLVWLSAVMTSVLAVASIFGVQDAGVPTYYVVAIAVILWLTDLFSNFAEALAEGRGKAQADSLRAAKKDVEAHRIESVEDKEHFTVVPGTELTRGDLVIVRAGEQIPGDGDVIEGAASVDESAITGESARGARGRRRPLGSHRRHHGSLRLDRGRDLQRAGQELPRQDDRHGRGRGAQEDP